MAVALVACGKQHPGTLPDPVFASIDAGGGGLQDAGTIGAQDAGAIDARDAGTIDATSLEGLRQVGYASVPRAHATQGVVSGDTFFVSTSGDGVQAYRIAPDGQLSLAWQRPMDTDAAISTSPPRCTTLALHAPTSTLYCAASDVPGISWFHVGDPTRLELDLRSMTSLGPMQGFRAVAVVGDTLLLAGFSRGLLRAPIGADGAPGAIESAGVAGTILDVAGTADALAVLDRARGLVQLRANGAGWTEVGVLPLDGPLLDLSVAGGRAYVALGSQGIAVVDLAADGPRLARRFRPDDVVQGVDGAGDVVVASTAGGVMAFDLAPSVPRPFGFRPTYSASMDVRLVGTRVYAVDWWTVDSFELDPAGSVRGVVSPPGFVVAPGRGVAFEVSNPGDRPLTVVVTAPGVGASSSGTELLSQAVGPMARVEISLPGAALARTRDAQYRTALQISTREDANGWSTDSDNFVVLSRGAADDPSRSLPALGDGFPILRVGPGAAGPASVPAAGQRTRVSFFVSDCAQQWRSLEDLAWSAQRSTPADGPVPAILFVTLAGEDTSWFGSLLGTLDAAALPHGVFESYLASLPTSPGAPALSAEDTFAERFGTVDIRGADTTADFLLDASGVVANFERVYRGEHGLGARSIP